MHQTALTAEDIDNAYTDARWLGWGYLGGRKQLDSDDRAAADATVLAYANAHGWGPERLFAWMNSRPGRHFADWPGQPGAEMLLGASLEANR